MCGMILHMYSCNRDNYVCEKLSSDSKTTHCNQFISENNDVLRI